MTRWPLPILLLGGAISGLGSSACGKEPPPPASVRGAEEAAVTATRSPEQSFAHLEERLLAAREVRITGAITSEGAVESTLKGTLHLSGNDEVSLAFSGLFASRPVDPHLESDGRVLRGGSSSGTFEQDSPPGLREALLLGATRMGLLHYLAVLSSGAPPDRTDGTIREWVQVSGLRRGPEGTVAGRRAEQLAFEITVDGRPSGEVVLWLDEGSGLPLQREQVVHFEKGDMKVIERYEVFQLDGVR